MTDANGNTVNTEYDKLGRAIKVQTPFDDTVSGETKTYYDKNSNIIKTAVKRSENKYQIEEYKYDNMGNLLASITNDGKTDTVTQYKYDTANRVTKMITGLSAYSENPAGGAVTQYSYNNLGYLAKTTDPMGLSETYNSYDYAGNLLSVTDKNSNTMYNTYGTYGLVKSYFNNSPETKEYTYNKIGQVTSAKSVNANEQSVEENYSYDPFGRLISSISNDGSVQNYTYDANSNVETYELVEDDVVKNSIEYAYNTLNQMTTLTNNGIVTSYTYDANGNLTNKLLSTGVNTNYTYNKAGLMTYMESKKGNNVYTYSKCKYLLNGLVNRVDMQYDNNPAEGKIKYYNYDDAGRLIADNITNAAGFPVANSYEYDLYGNRVKMVSSPGDEEETETINYEYDLNNRLLNENSYVYNSYRNTDSYSSTHYYYDYNGNMTAKQKTYFGGSNNNNAVLSGRSTDTGLSVYRYDAFNRLANYNSGSNEASYTYNANNLRTSKTVNREKTNFVWNGQNLAAENKTDITNTYTYDMTGVHIANQNGTVTSYLKDYHGNIAGKTTKTGAMFNEMGTTMDYDAFGNQWQGDVPDPFGYCGEYLDGESGLIYLRNRYYDSTTGRFITEDPVKDGLNWYNYCGGNPVVMVDPSGLIMILNGTGDEVQTIWKNIKEFSQDELVLTQIKDEEGNLTDSYEVTIKEERDGGCNIGTELVRRLVNNKERTVNVKITDGGNYESDKKHKKAINGKGSDTEVFFNPNSDPDILSIDPITGNVEPEKRPAFIGLAHEFIHADRSMRGDAIYYGEEADIQYQVARVERSDGSGYDYLYETQTNKKEELATVGLGYNGLNDITENMIRAEHGLKLRGAY